MEHARELLQDSEPVVRAAYESGPSGPGRLDGHFVRVEAVTPGEVKRRGRDLTLRTGVHATPFGDALLALTDRGICFLAFLGSAPGEASGGDEREARAELRARWPEADLVDDPAGTAATAERIFSALDGRDPGGAVTAHLRGTNFQLQVWKALLRIPPGRTVTYGSIAASLGRPTAARAVGGAVGRNPVAFLVPCHRVIRAGGDLGGYRWDRDRKRAMLEWEAARFGEGD